MKKEVTKYLRKVGNLYSLKVGNMVVELQYSEDNKKIDERMKNILRQKSKLG